jgi:amidase
VLDEAAAFAGVSCQLELFRRGDVSSLEAAQADARITAGESRSLIGVPVAVKDEIDIGGEITSHGTGGMVTRAPADAEVVRRVRVA